MKISNDFLQGFSVASLFISVLVLTYSHFSYATALWFVVALVSLFVWVCCLVAEYM